MTLIEWLTQCGCTEIQPVRVTLGDKTYEGCQYKQHTDEPRIYCVGEVTKKWHDKTCFTKGAETWYSAGYMTQDRITEQFAKFHPFGANFILMLWPADAFHEAIDAYAEKPYTRIEMKVDAAV